MFGAGVIGAVGEEGDGGRRKDRIEKEWALSVRSRVTVFRQHKTTRKGDIPHILCAPAIQLPDPCGVIPVHLSSL